MNPTMKQNSFPFHIKNVVWYPNAKKPSAFRVS